MVDAVTWLEMNADREETRNSVFCPVHIDTMREAVKRIRDLEDALQKLSFAVMARENVMGNPIRLMDAKANLNAATKNADSVLKGK